MLVEVIKVDEGGDLQQVTIRRYHTASNDGELKINPEIF